MSRVSIIRAAGVASAAGIGVFVLTFAAWAAGPFEGFAGSWSGSGQIRLEDGRSEGLRCHAHYATRQGGTALGLALRCASASNKIDLHADLRSTGDRVAGNWEERTFNVAGSASGRASGNSLRLEIDGGAFSGLMAVTTNGRNQSVSVRTDGAALRGINISLRHE